jgi:hypothetical protein
MEMIAAVGAFLDEHAGQLTPRQEQFAAVFLLEFADKRAISMWSLVQQCKGVGIHVYYSKAKAGRGWRVKFK